MNENDDGYQRQVQAQITQYSASSADMHAAAPIADHVLGKFRAPRLREVFGTSSIPDLFAGELLAAIERSQNRRVASLGAGDCAVEIQVAKRIVDAGRTDFEFICYELSPVLVDRGRAAIAAVGLDKMVRVVQQDLNTPVSIDGVLAGFMAHHSLHHVVDLESLFDTVFRHLHDRGSFVVADVIGRNGHSRWPETLALVREIWTKLPERLKFDRVYGRTDCWFENRDCSIEGFEGIRAQDILPLLLERFSFRKFTAWGGLVDVFTNRSFGPNYDPACVDDISFIDSLQAAEDRLLDARKLTPTCMIAIIDKRADGPVKGFAGVSPTSCVRPTAPSFQPPRIPLSTAGVAVPYREVATVDATPLPLGASVSFGAQDDSERFLRWGWSDPEGELRWGVGESSALEFACAAWSSIRITVRMLGYIPSFAKEQRIVLQANGIIVGEALFANRDHLCQEFVINLPPKLLGSGRCTLEFVPSAIRRPDAEGGEEKRPITFALLTLNASNAGAARFFGRAIGFAKSVAQRFSGGSAG